MPAVLEIANITIDPTIPSLRFRCDLERCKGACCTLPGGRGAPLHEDELEDLKKAYPAVRPYLSKEHQDTIAREGLFEGSPGHRFTTCVGEEACVFVIRDNGVARCGLEQAYLRGETTWRKPVSCHLFPLRFDQNSGRLRFEYLSACEPAYEHAEESSTYLAEFVTEALERSFGASWTRSFLELCRSSRAVEMPGEDS